MVEALLSKIKHGYGADERSFEARKSIALSLLAKGMSIIISMIVVPLTINYLNPSQYGIWLTLSSIIAWISFFDLGLGNGFRNKFAEAKANGDITAAKEYVSTTYFSVGLIFLAVFAILAIVNCFLDWSSILKIDSTYREELGHVFSVLSLFFCLNMVAQTFTTLLTADQKPGIAAIVNVIGQACALIAMLALVKGGEGSMLKLAFFYSGMPPVILVLISIFAFGWTSYGQYKPSIKRFNSKLVKSIINLGVQFFAIYLCQLLIFQLTNLILARETGAESVTQYNIAFKYFNMLQMVAIIVITPFWSAFTDAYAKKDFEWMNSAMKRLERFWLITIATGIVMLLLSGWFYKIWIGGEVQVPTGLSVATLIYVLASILGNIYMFMINGIGTIRIQLLIYIALALIALPALIFTCRWFGVSGIVIVPTAVFLIQAVFGKIQLEKIINGTAYGIWLK